MRRYNHSLVLLTSLFLYLTLISCRKFVDVPPPESQVSSATIFANDQGATSAMVGLYVKMMTASGLFNGQMSFFAGLASDELQRGIPFAMYDVFQQNEIPVNNGTVSTIWATGYSYIFQANAVLEGVAASNGLSASVRQQIKGEALFVRALTYFYLVNLYGDVPLVLTTDYDENAFLARSAETEVYARIVADLREAVGLLPTNYVTTATYPGARVRPNRFAAMALLSRVLLYRKDYAGAETQASAVIGSGLYSLEPNASNVFLAGSKEAIWQLMPVTNFFNTAEGNTFIPFTASSLPGFILSPEVLSRFEPDDLRKAAWTQNQTVNGRSYVYPFKYKVRSGGAPYAEYNMVLRLAEVYLIRAEAFAHDGNVPAAVGDLNRIRKRAGLPELSDTIPQADVLAEIEKENLLEFFAEWGHRWLDLKRTGRADAVLSAVKGASWQPTDVLWPIPFTQLQLNYKLEQNPGY